ncbi:hypothetical protein AB0K62_08885 [Streptomyces halstedii]|uniref:hypothetical protein n=1 Tax=Streptomyces halstedii TaxID=1944 RepID=UPI003460198B
MTMEHWIAFWTALWVGSSRITHRTVDWLCNAKPKPTTAPAKTEKKQPETAAGEAEEQTEAAPGEQPKTPKKTATKTSAKASATEEAEGSALLRWASILIAAAVAKSTPYTTTIALILAAAWVLTALALGYAAARPAKPPTAEKKATETADEKSAADTRHPHEILTRDHVALLLAEVYTEGSGVHLSTLAQHLTKTPLVGLPATAWKTADVRALLARHKVRVRPGVRVPPTGTREGVHRDDFPPLPQPPSGPPVVGAVVPGQGNNNNAPAFTVTDDPDHPVRHTVHHAERT